MTPTRYLRLSLATLILCLPLLAHAGDDWAHKKKLQIDTTSTGADLKEGASQVPVLVRLHSGNFAFTEAKPDGTDLRFFAADGKTPLRFHVEKFDAANELGIVWVQVTKLVANSKADSLIMQWGNPKAESAADAKGTYDAAQLFDFHFSDAASVKDATGNANNASASTAKTNPAGPMDGAAVFDGSARINLPASPTLRLAPNGFTLAAWVKPTSGRGTLYKQADGKKSLVIGLAGNSVSVSVNGVTAAVKAPLKPGVWQHLAVVAGGGKLLFYVDGQNAGNGEITVPDLAGETVVGEGFSGEMDELALSAAPRTADYIKALHSSQTDESRLVTFADDDGAGETTSYISILLGAVTVDGWVVIGILMVMFIISVAVMVTKTRFVLRAREANEVFVERFAEKSEDLLTPGNPEVEKLAADTGVVHSAIHRLYRIGLRELQHRFEAQTRAGDAHALSGPALDSIRASIDAGLVRENQRLNSQMVLLTIAISGGPFLGLLGTVVGVMITFAAIAASGDVNVNSIAPGIAAALVATVAGLAVAIPALFGYNWLASQIKNVSSDMQVFADEFVTKAAELHSR